MRHTLIVVRAADTPTGSAGFLPGPVRLAGHQAQPALWRGSLDRMIRDVACRRAAALATERIIAEIRGMAGSRRNNIGVSYLETLTDILVHGQDIAIPLGHRLDMPPRAAAVAASRVLSMRWPPAPSLGPEGGRVPAHRHRYALVHRGGPEAKAPISAILLVCTGRLAALPQLSGQGAPGLTAHLSAPAPS